MEVHFVPDLSMERRIKPNSAVLADIFAPYERETGFWNNRPSMVVVPERIAVVVPERIAVL